MIDTRKHLNTMARFHGEGDRDSPIVKLEYKEMVEDISVTGSDKRWWDYRELFNSREARYRLMLVMCMAFLASGSGNGPVSYYYPTMLQAAGIEDNHDALLFQRHGKTSSPSPAPSSVPSTRTNGDDGPASCIHSTPRHHLFGHLCLTQQ